MKAVTTALLVGTLMLCTSVLAQVTVLTHATVIDGTGVPPQKDMTIVMEHGRIRDTGPSALIEPPADAAAVDLGGRFVVPGIINAHGHVGARTEPQLRQYALYGVTTPTACRPIRTRWCRCAGRRSAASARLARFHGEVPFRSRSEGGDIPAGTRQGRRPAGAGEEPARNISHMRTIQTVYLGGRKFE